jgi:hypothetical protein
VFEIREGENDDEKISYLFGWGGADKSTSEEGFEMESALEDGDYYHVVDLQDAPYYILDDPTEKCGLD